MKDVIKFISGFREGVRGPSEVVFRHLKTPGLSVTSQACLYPPPCGVLPLSSLPPSP